jgi:hypothetical protein
MSPPEPGGCGLELLRPDERVDEIDGEPGRDDETDDWIAHGPLTSGRRRRRTARARRSRQDRAPQTEDRTSRGSTENRNTQRSCRAADKLSIGMWGCRYKDGVRIRIVPGPRSALPMRASAEGPNTDQVGAVTFSRSRRSGCRMSATGIQQRRLRAVGPQRREDVGCATQGSTGTSSARTGCMVAAHMA